MSTHTKGPWTTKLVPESLAMNGVGIVEVNGPKGIVCNLEESTIEETNANAALISAAPEMLEALEFIVSEEHLDPNLVSLLEALEVTSRGKKAIVMVRRALSKARGEK